MCSRYRRRTIIVLAIGACTALWGLILPDLMLAQNEGTERYIAPDRSFQFSYPAGWMLETSDEGSIVVSDGDTFVHLLDPVLLNSYGLGYVTDPRQLLKEVMNSLDIIEPQDVYTITLEGRDIEQYTYLEEGLQGYLLAVPFADGNIGLIDAYRADNDLSLNDPLVMTLAASFDTVGTNTFPATLRHTQDGWQQATEELAARGLIPAGYERIFVEDRAFFTGQGAFFTPLARDKPAADLVMGGQLTYTPGSETYEDCVLAARIDIGPDDTVYAYLDVGINNHGEVFFFDYTGDETTAAFGAAPLESDLEQPHQFLLLLLDNRLTVYMDGQLMFENRIIEDRAGIFGIGLTGSGPQAHCEGQDIWAVEIPYVQPGLCEVSANTPVNRRAGPGTTHEAMGRLLPSTSVRVTGQTTGGDGYTWWLLADESWVREDVVNEIGSCATVPDAFEDIAPSDSQSA